MKASIAFVLLFVSVAANAQTQAPANAPAILFPAVEICAQLDSGSLVFTDDSVTSVDWRSITTETDSALDANLRDFNELLDCITAVRGAPTHLTHGSDPHFRQAMWEVNRGQAYLSLNHEWLSFVSVRLAPPDPKRRHLEFKLTE